MFGRRRRPLLPILSPMWAIICAFTIVMTWIRSLSSFLALIRLSWKQREVLRVFVLIWLIRRWFRWRMRSQQHFVTRLRQMGWLLRGTSSWGDEPYENEPRHEVRSPAAALRIRPGLYPYRSRAFYTWRARTKISKVLVRLARRLARWPEIARFVRKGPAYGLRPAYRGRYRPRLQLARQWIKRHRSHRNGNRNGGRPIHLYPTPPAGDGA